MADAALTLASPLGPLALVVDDHGALVAVSFDAAPDGAPSQPATPTQTAALDTAAAQLAEYFAGHRRVFDLGLAPRGTEFQRRVWRALGELPFGTTESYGALAIRLGAPRAVRAVGRANGKNPLAIVVPCHRVIGASGQLVGYAGGLARKQALLALEGVRPLAAQPAARPTDTRGNQLSLL